MSGPPPSPLWRAAFVRRLPREGKLSVSLETLEAGATQTQVACKLLRDPNEEVSKTLARLTKTLAKHRKPDKVTACEVELRDSSRIDAGLTAQNALVEKGVAILVNGAERFQIRVDHPRVNEIITRGFPIVGCPIAPWAEGEDLGKKRSSLRWTWTYAAPPAATATSSSSSSSSSSSPSSQEPSQEEAAAAAAAAAGTLAGTKDLATIAHTRSYTPTEADVGRRLAVTCVPSGDFAAPVSLELDEAVMPSPPWSAVRDRISAKSEGDDTVRVMSYNILADTYSHTWDEMYAYCDPKFRDLRYRAPLLAREVVLCNADIICLQEVDAKMFDFWRALLAPDYVCRFTPKDGSGMEGCLFAARTARFRLSHFEAVSFKELVQRRRETTPWLEHLLQTVDSLEDSISKVKSIAQLAVLETVGPSLAGHREVVVTNTHSFFHPGAGNIRCLQAKLLADLVQEQRRERARGRKQEESGQEVPVVMCGDWNAQSYDLSLQFLLKGAVPADHPEWATSSIFQYESKANLARDVIFEDAGKDSQRYMDILSQKTESGRALPVSDLQEQVDAVDEGVSLVDKLNVVAELKDGLAWHNDPADRVAILDMIASMQGHLQASREQLIASQRARAEAHGRLEADEAVGCGAHLTHELALFSAYGEPAFTNYVGNWKGDLDWILCSRNSVEVVQVAPIPSEATLQIDTALPSRTFPSDHISLCADLRFVSTKPCSSTAAAESAADGR